MPSGGGPPDRNSENEIVGSGNPLDDPDENASKPDGTVSFTDGGTCSTVNGCSSADAPDDGALDGALDDPHAATISDPITTASNER